MRQRYTHIQASDVTFPCPVDNIVASLHDVQATGSSLALLDLIPPNCNSFSGAGEQAGETWKDERWKRRAYLFFCWLAWWPAG